MFCITAHIVFGVNDKSISLNELPSMARFFLRTEFPKSKVLSVYISSETESFEVLTDDNSQFSFDSDGNWQTLNCPKVGIPTFVIPQKMQTAIRKNCTSKTKVILLKRLSRGRYDVELSNGFGLRFDKKLEIIDVRDRSLMIQNF